MAGVNGNGRLDEGLVLDRLVGPPLTEGYSPPFPGWMLGLASGFAYPQFYLFGEVEIMMTHPIVWNALSYYKGAISGADFEGPKDMNGQPKPVSQNPAVAEFVVSQCRRFWDRGLQRVQNGYEYGWIGLENLFAEVQGGPQDGLLEWVGCLDFWPRHCYLLTQDNRPVGCRVNNVNRYTQGGPSGGRADLWFASGAVPAKGLWYTHNPRYNRFYGQSQLLRAWRPWRRLASKDGAETVLDGGFYRGAFSGPLVRYPEENLQGAQGQPATFQSNAGQYFRDARDFARQMAEYMKAGASIGLPSTCYPPDLGGKYKWEVEWPENHFDGGPVLAYVEHLIKMTREGIGVPNELIEAAETGSGYSGRAIPLEGFLQGQQGIANSILNLFVSQVVKPLVLWNRSYFEQYGPLDFEVCVANLLETKLKAAMNKGGAEPGMQAGGGMQGMQGMEDTGGQPIAGADGVTWSPINTDEGERAWKSSGGLVRKGQTPPGALAGAQMSLWDQGRRDEVIRIAQLSGRVA